MLRKPYISVNKATVKALNVPSDRHSQRLFGLRYPRVKKMNIPALMATESHIP
jgi:hypothetical protein